MNARGEQGVAFGGWCFSKATGRNLAHVPELHPPPSSFPWGTGDEWRAPELLHGAVVQKVPLVVTVFPQAPALRPGSISLHHQQPWPGCMGPDLPQGQYSSTSPKQ